MFKRLITFGFICAAVLVSGCQSAIFGNREIESTRVLAIEDEEARTRVDSISRLPNIAD